MSSYSEVVAASTVLFGHAVQTPLVHAPELDAICGGKVFLKLENLQRVNSFKFRGAYNYFAHLSAEQRAKGVVAVSSGNHAQGVALAARLFNSQATIIMSDLVPANKQARTRALGASVKLHSRIAEERYALADKMSQEKGATIIHPFNHPAVIAGQGTVGLEIVSQAAAQNVTPDILLCSVGGGGLIAGIALAFATEIPYCKIYAVEPEDFDDYRRSLAEGSLVSNEQESGSICDALLSPQPGDIGFSAAAKHIAGGLAVSDEEVLVAVGYLYEKMRLVVEPGGAVAIAALLFKKLELSGNNIVIVISGGNIEFDTLSQAIAAFDNSDFA